MKKIVLLSVVFLGVSLSSLAQTKGVGIGIKEADASAALHIESTTQGFLLPRMIKEQINDVQNPIDGLMVFCTDCTPKELYVATGDEFRGVRSGNIIEIEVAPPTEVENFYTYSKYYQSELNNISGEYNYVTQDCEENTVYNRLTTLVVDGDFYHNEFYTLYVEDVEGSNTYTVKYTSVLPSETATSMNAGIGYTLTANDITEAKKLLSFGPPITSFYCESLSSVIESQHPNNVIFSSSDAPGSTRKWIVRKGFKDEDGEVMATGDFTKSVTTDTPAFPYDTSKFSN